MEGVTVRRDNCISPLFSPSALFGCRFFPISIRMCDDQDLGTKHDGNSLNSSSNRDHAASGRADGLDLHPHDSYGYGGARFNRFSQAFGPPRNMDEMSELMASIKEDLFSLKRKHQYSPEPRGHWNRDSYSRSRSRDRHRYRSRSRSHSRCHSPRRRERHGHRRHYRSYSRSPSRARARRSSTRDSSRTRRASPRSRSRSSITSRREHELSSSETSLQGSDTEGNKGKNKPPSGEPTNPDQPTEDPDNPFCNYVKQIATDSTIGDAMDPWLAQFVEKSMSSPPGKDALQEILDKYKRPENVKNLQVPAVENSVWLAISSKARTKDNLRQKHQDTFIKLMIALTSAADELNKRYMSYYKDERDRAEWMLSPLEKLKDAIVVGGFHNLQDITKRRRYDLEFFMPEKYRRLCSDFNTFPPTPTALLGENIEDSVKQMDITNKLTQKLDKNSKVNSGGQGQNNNNNRDNHHYKKDKSHKNKRGFKPTRNYDNRSSSGHNNAKGDGANRKNQDFRRGGPPKTN